MARKKTADNQWFTYDLPTVLYTGILMCFVMWIYAPIIAGDFLLLEDFVLLITNPQFAYISLETLWNMVTSYDVLHQYQPLTSFVYIMQYIAFGFNTKMFHLSSVVLHALNTLLVFLFVTQLTKREAIGFTVALLFGIHPLQSEAVSWVSAFNEVLSTFFLLSSYLAYLTYCQKKEGSYFGLSFLFYFCALVSKPMLSTFPFLLLLMDWYQRRKITQEVLREKFVFLLLAIVFWLVTIRTLPPSQGIETVFNQFFFPFWRFSLYVQKIIYPVGLSPAHPIPTDISLNTFGFLLTFLLPFLFLLVVYWAYRRNRGVLFGLGFFALTLLSVVLPFTVLRNNFLPERYAYFALVGFFLAVVLWIEPFIHRIRLKSMHPQAWVMVVLVIISVPFAAVTSKRVRDWRSNEELFLSIIKTYPNSPVAHHQLAMLYQMRGEHQRAAQHYLWFFQTQKVAIETAADYLFLGTFFEGRLLHSSAAWAYGKAYQLNPELTEAKQRLDMVLRKLEMRAQQEKQVETEAYEASTEANDV